MDTRCTSFLVLIVLSTPVLNAADGPPAALVADPLTAVEHWRAMEYDNRPEAVVSWIAPAAPGFVDSRSKAATRGLIDRIQEQRYGFRVLDASADGDAGVAILLTADRDSATVDLMPFYCWRSDGAWRYLPNPTVVETWYQRVPDDLEPGYGRLATWYREAETRFADLVTEDPGELIDRWWAAYQQVRQETPADR